MEISLFNVKLKLSNIFFAVKWAKYIKKPGNFLGLIITALVSLKRNSA